MSVGTFLGMFRQTKPVSATWKERLHSQERFREILNSERQRADRSGIQFCVVVYALDSSQQSNCETFIQSVQQRMRGTDYAGLMGNSEVGIILWDTKESGARKFAQAVTDEKLDGCIEATKIYVYPKLDGMDELKKAKTLGVSQNKQENKSPEKAVQVEPLHMLYVQQLPTWKRALDVVGAGIGLILLSPLLFATAIAIKLTSKGPILFKQERDGLGGKRFVIFKFRTMRQDAERLKDELRKLSEQDGPAFKLTKDPRITPIGRYLRKTCIDELPQLWNVIKGDMTLVGPRPLECGEGAKVQGWERRRLDVTPGLTCIWQVYGKSKVSFTEWMRMDIRYIGQKTFLKDMKLIFDTIVAVVCHRASV